MLLHLVSRTVLASVDVCVASVAYASCFLDLVFVFALPVAFLERVHLHPAVMIRTCSISS